jgi:hypothetical protein
MKYIIATALAMLVGCQSATTPEGCPIMISEVGQAYMQSCIAAYQAEKARLAGKKVTTCQTVGNTTTCIED